MSGPRTFRQALTAVRAGRVLGQTEAEAFIRQVEFLESLAEASGPFDAFARAHLVVGALQPESTSPVEQRQCRAFIAAGEALRQAGFTHLSTEKAS